MQTRREKPVLTVILGGKNAMGPASRLQLFDRFPKPDLGRISLNVVTKLLLLGVVLYVSQSLRLR
ncbi:MAG: hypothetical protein EB078_13140 [Proteobacteria bacterium]|nr:hypothetical protein [Pseudomonadota bacterium]NDC25990.1 hypothetical protein [Pseudomonadota bacterium]NDD05843.1 hypothetical protein [Pseudomonadota bacterium]NDG25899.1 hypothetical protein [Pseudomonadota bacterium]